MFEAGNTYNTADGLTAHIMGEVNDDGIVWLIGYVINKESTILPEKWLKKTGNTSLTGSNENISIRNLVMPIVALELNWAEARALRAILHHHITGPDDGPRKHANSINDQLHKAGIKSSNLPRVARSDARLYLEGTR